MMISNANGFHLLYLFLCDMLREFLYFYTVKRIEQFWKYAIQMLYIIITIIIIFINKLTGQLIVVSRVLRSKNKHSVKCQSQTKS